MPKRPGFSRDSSAGRCRRWAGKTSSDSTIEKIRTPITISGMLRENCPMVPGMNSIGVKATIVVRIAKITGFDISEVPVVAAQSPSFLPRSVCRLWWIFSATTIASSTTIPSTMMNANREIMFTETSI